MEHVYQSVCGSTYVSVFEIQSTYGMAILHSCSSGLTF